MKRINDIDDTNPYQPAKLLLPTFKELYAATQPLPFWLRHLIYGLLVWIENHYLDQHIENTVTHAIEQIQTELDNQNTMHWKEDATLTITENPDTLHKLPTLQITAPYATDTNNNGTQQ